MSVECPRCGYDNAYHDGCNYVCPDCGYEWDDGNDFDPDSGEGEVNYVRFDRGDIWAVLTNGDEVYIDSDDVLDYYGRQRLTRGLVHQLSDDLEGETIEYYLDDDGDWSLDGELSDYI